MNEHEQETRELEQGMERALAVAIAHTSALIEAWAKHAAKKARQSGDNTDPEMAQFYTTMGIEAAETQQQVRAELAVAQPNADYWKHASAEELSQKMRQDYNVDPARIGERTHDRHWAERAEGRYVVDLYAMADRYADQNAAAAAVRDNLGDLMRDYGLDPDELMRSSPEVAAQRYTQSRAEHWGPGRAPALTASVGEATDRDGAHVAALLSQAQAADREADHAADLSEATSDTAAHANTEHANTEPSRAERVSAASTTDAGKAAATAARDHPTNPRAATTTPRAQSAGRRTAGMGADRERGRGM